MFVEGLLRPLTKAKKSKSLPKRTGRRKDRRARMIARQNERKLARNAANLERAAKNKELRAAGLPTPWEVAKAKARARRLNK